MMRQNKVPDCDALEPLKPVAVRSDWSGEEQLDIGASIYRGMCDLDVADTIENPGIDQSNWVPKDMALATAQTNDLTANGMETMYDAAEWLCVEVPYNGFVVDEDNTVRREEIAIYSTNQEHRDVARDHTFATFFLPFDIIGFDPTQHFAESFLEKDSSIGRLLDAAITGLVSRLPHMPLRDAPGKFDDVAGLVRDLVLQNRSYPNRSAINAARRMAMETFIEDNLRNPDISSASLLLKEFNVSRSVLFRIFEEDGGLRNYVNRRRLHRSLLELQNTVAQRGAVRRVAEGFGFWDPANFNRAFKSEFGFKPTEIVGVHDVGRIPEPPASATSLPQAEQS